MPAERATVITARLVLDASAVVRIIEGSTQAASLAQAVAAADLVLARREVATLLSTDQRLLDLASRVLP